MQLTESRAAYQEFSAKASELSRKLSFSAIAIIWVFKQGAGNELAIPAELFGPALFTVLSLAFDLLQYAIAAVLWGAFSRYKEIALRGRNVAFRAPAWINYPVIACFYAKLAANTVAYVLLLLFLAERFR